MRYVFLLLSMLCLAVFMISTSASGNGWDKGYSEQTKVLQLNVEQVAGMQRMLEEQGFITGEIDGIIGGGTSAAIRQFQQAEGLTVSGQPNVETLRELGPYSEQQEFFGLAPEFHSHPASSE